MAQSETPASAVAPSRKWWNDERARGILYQILLLLFVAAGAWFLVDNTLANLRTRHIATGFDFLGREARFDISEYVIAFSPADSYFHALLVGLLNTLKVAFLGIILATLLGIVMGIARLASNWLVARIATVYVELIRNVPLLLQLLFWYELITNALPVTRQAFNFFDLAFLSNRGFRIPSPIWDGRMAAFVIAFLIGIVATVILARWARKRQELTGQPFPTVFAGLGLILGLPLLSFLIGGAQLEFDVPKLTGFNFTGGAALSPEFAALLIGLVVYTGAFIAEIVRGGIQAVAKGQTEAGLAVGLTRGQLLRLVVLPQALRVITPPMTSQYLNLTKNSVLAVAIGFPDLVSVANTMINQTGQAVEGVSIILVVYLVISLLLSAFMNWYNKRVALRGGSR